MTDIKISDQHFTCSKTFTIGLDHVKRSLLPKTIGLHVLMHLSQCMRFPTMMYVRPAKPQISLRIRAV